jgi:hypothetical protein
MVLRKSVGPHHRAKCSGSRKARKTFCRDAFNSRVYANSGSAVFVDESESD